MIGIFAITGGSADELEWEARGIAAGMHTNRAWTADLTAVAEAACGRIGPARQDAVWRSADGLHLAWLDGYAFTHGSNPDNDRVASAGDLAEALLTAGPSALLGFQGEFCLLVLDRRARRLFAATDRFGARTTYWHAAGGRFAVGSELGQLLRQRFVRRTLDYASLAGLFRFNKCRLGHRTLFEGINVLPPGAVVEVDLTRPAAPTTHAYVQHATTREIRSNDEWVEAILPVLRRAVRNSVGLSGATRGPALALSGGLDSRLVLGSLTDRQQTEILLVSCGLSESSDVTIARDVSAAVGGRYRNIALGPSDFLAWAQSGVTRNEEFDIFVQGAQTALHQAAAAEADVLLTGWDLDLQLRGTYLNDVVVDDAGIVDVKKTIDAKWTLFSMPELSGLLQERYRRDAEDAVEELLRTSLAMAASADPLQQYLQFVALFEKRRLLMLRHRMIRFELESSVPLYDTRLQTLLAAVPEPLKAGDRLFARVLNAMTPTLAALPYQRTLLPATVPVEFWKRASALEEAKEQLLREVFVATGIRIPYTRYYTNFDEWLLSDPGWNEFVRSMLTSSRTMLTDLWIDRSALDRLLQENRDGVRSHRGKIVYLLSLELYLREYFS